MYTPVDEGTMRGGKDIDIERGSRGNGIESNNRMADRQEEGSNFKHAVHHKRGEFSKTLIAKGAGGGRRGEERNHGRAETRTHE